MSKLSTRFGAFANFGKAPLRMLSTFAVLVSLTLLTACPPPPGELPTDAQDACPLPSATFNTWFHSGSVMLNGVVDPADSTQSLAPNCGFYSWSERMFLWLNSPAPATYGGGGGRIFNSPAFFDVSPPDASGHRKFLAHTPGAIMAIPLRAAQLGPHHLPVIVDRFGELREIKPPVEGSVPRVRDVSGKEVEIAHVRQEKRTLVLLDHQGQVIHPLMTNPRERAKEGRRVLNANNNFAHRFLIDGFPIFIDPSLAVIDVEQGQAGDSGVLEAQTASNGSLVYYATMVNDVYAYFATGVKDGAISASQFPLSSADLVPVTAFASGHGVTFPDPNALAIEVKSSWVRAAGLPNLSSYITMQATVPTYNTADPHNWTPTGQETVQLAMVGMHVVGSTLGHPEMVWATFEHVGNTPVAGYSYNSTGGQQTVPQTTAANWVFAGNGSSGPFNMAHMFFNGPPANTIQAAGSFTISPSDTLRMEPFGLDGPSNPSSNTEVISMNNHVRGMLANGDIRHNYIMTGATWIAGGGPPSTGFQVGTSSLTNTTMETYQQGTNCFACHQDPSMLGNANGTGLSHIFGGLDPLF